MISSILEQHSVLEQLQAPESMMTWGLNLVSPVLEHLQVPVLLESPLNVEMWEPPRDMQFDQNHSETEIC